MLRSNKKKKEGTVKSENRKNLLLLLRACRDNAIDLIKEAQILYDNECYQRAFALAYTANEEVSKGQIVADYISGVVSDEELKRAFKNHDIKAAYNNVEIVIGETLKTETKVVHDGKELTVSIQDNTLQYDLSHSKGEFLARNRSLYVDFEKDYTPVIPKENFQSYEAEQMLSAVKERLSFIFYAEEFNGRIGTKALIK